MNTPGKYNEDEYEIWLADFQMQRSVYLCASFGGVWAGQGQEKVKKKRFLLPSCWPFNLIPKMIQKFWIHQLYDHMCQEIVYQIL